MSEEILINVTPMETRVALIENGLLQEIFVERPHSKGHVGDIYLGKVVRVMPGMEAAFVDIGLERAAFIHSADISLFQKHLRADLAAIRRAVGLTPDPDAPSAALSV